MSIANNIAPHPNLETPELESESTFNKVILHCIGRGKTIVHPSPFVLKLETYLRMADIPYMVDTKKPYAPTTKKMPWITFNDEIVTDSQIIIEYLNDKFGKNLWGNNMNVTEEQKAIARATRIALEEHFWWGMIHWRFVKGFSSLADILPIPSLKFKLAKLILPRKIQKSLVLHGIGRHSYDNLIKLTSEDLRDISNLLGDKPFFLGEEPTEADAAIFGVLAQVIWAAPGSPYESIVHDELQNLQEYCERIKDLYWSDWDELLVVEG